MEEPYTEGVATHGAPESNQGEPPAPAWARSARLFDAVVESF